MFDYLVEMNMTIYRGIKYVVESLDYLYNHTHH